MNVAEEIIVHVQNQINGKETIAVMDNSHTNVALVRSIV